MDREAWVGQILARLKEDVFASSSVNSEETIGTLVQTAPQDLQPRLRAEFLGDGPLESLFSDRDVTEILVNGPRNIWFEKAGQLSKIEDGFLSPETFEAYIRKIQKECGIDISLDVPYFDCSWRDFRIHLIGRPCADTWKLSMRRNSSMVWSLDSLHKVGWASSKAIGILAELVRARDSLLVVGGTSSGKTTVLSSLIREIPEMERVICLEDTHELGRPTPAGLQLLTRSDAKGVLREISLSDLVRQALRMRPDRLVLGEVRGPEAKDLLMALATGHDGSLGTLHANSAAEALLRLEMLIQLGAPQWSLNSIRRLIFLALRYIVVVKRNRLGQRKLEGIFRLASMEEFGILVEKVDV